MDKLVAAVMIAFVVAMAWRAFRKRNPPMRRPTELHDHEDRQP